MISTKKLNNVNITPLETREIDPNRIKGQDFFPDLFPNVLLVARKKSGKTTVLYHILKNCIDERTKVFIFCSTIHNDLAYKEIIQMLTENKIPFELFTDIVENKVNKLAEIINQFEREGLSPYVDEEEKVPLNPEEESKKIGFLMFGGKKKESQKKKYKDLVPRYVFVFDDISQYLRNPTLAFFVKQNRHYGCMNLISTQYYKDIAPTSWEQIDYVLLFKNLDEQTVINIRQKLVLPLKDEVFEQVYKYATKGHYNFLYINKNKIEYRQNFNNILEFNSNQTV